MPLNIGQRDIDIKVKSLASLDKILEKAKKDFEIAHYHNYSLKKSSYYHIDRFYGSLVDKQNKVKVDLFDIENFIPQQLNEYRYKGIKLLVRSLNDQIVTKMLETYRIFGISCRESAIDPKQFAELYWMVSISNPVEIQKLWSEHPLLNLARNNTPMTFPERFEDAYVSSLSWMYHRPEIVAKIGVSKTEKEKVSCAECVTDKRFPLR